LATDITGDPHALDYGTALGGLTLAMLTIVGRVAPGQRPRDAWATVGVDGDDIIGGLSAIGILPRGWQVPQGAALTLPPRVLKDCEWPRPEVEGSWVFVTENPSVLSAAADLAVHGSPARVLCMSGTPSSIEVGAIARLADSRWRVAVRADFDPAGIAHVNAVLSSVPGAQPWRMAVADYLGSSSSEASGALAFDSFPEARWDADLASVIRGKGSFAYEEALLPVLLDDLRRGRPDD
jgi:uncharacterized protein (TIGR02679 family)